MCISLLKKIIIKIIIKIIKPPKAVTSKKKEITLNRPHVVLDFIIPVWFQFPNWDHKGTDRYLKIRLGGWEFNESAITSYKSRAK